MAAYAGKIGKNARPPTGTVRGSVMGSKMNASRMGSAMKGTRSKINTGLQNSQMKPASQPSFN